MSAAQRRDRARRVALASAAVVALGALLLIPLARNVPTHTGPNYAIDRDPFLPADYEAPRPAASDPDFRLILVGDAGDAEADDPILALLARWADPHPERTAVLFLGDNLYPSGLVSENDERGKRVLRRLIDSTRARKIFLPGNHDWGTSMRRPLQPGALALQQEFIEGHGKHADFEPEDGCPGPAAIELAAPEPNGFRGLTVLALDLHWWMLDESHRPACASIRTTSDFVAVLRRELQARRHENVVVAAHHPIRSGGPHGGYTRGLWRDLLTSIAYRFYTLQDLVEPGYGEIVGVLTEVMAEAPPLAMVGGHDHSLQILDGGDASGLVVVSGSATRVSRVTALEGTLFAHAARGFVVLDLHAGVDGSPHVFARVVELGHDEPVADFAVEVTSEGGEADATPATNRFR